MIFTSNTSAFVIAVACFRSVQVKPAALHVCREGCRLLAAAGVL